jgi:hypothetical protein
VRCLSEGRRRNLEYDEAQSFQDLLLCGSLQLIGDDLHAGLAGSSRISVSDLHSHPHDSLAPAPVEDVSEIRSRIASETTYDGWADDDFLQQVTRVPVVERAAQGSFRRPHRIRGQRGDSDPEPGSAASAKRISAESECGFLHDGGAIVLDRAPTDAEAIWRTGMAFVITSSISYTAEMRSADVIGIRHERVSNWGLGGLIAAAVLLSPVLAFLMTLVVDVVIGFLNDGSVPAVLVLVAAGAIGGFLFRKLRMRPQDSDPDWT